ncbi:MAG TPA: phage holin family protein [Polyangiaceae bacterium]|jgi:cytochrome c biogenesis protein CcdA
MTPTLQERSVADLIGDLARETGTLVRQEMKLATTEMSDKARIAGRQAAVMAGAAVCSAVSLLTLVAALVLGIGTAIPLWASALIVGIGLAVIGGLLGITGVATLKELDPKPRQSIREIEETTSWVQRRVHQQ